MAGAKTKTALSIASIARLISILLGSADFTAARPATSEVPDIMDFLGARHRRRVFVRTIEDTPARGGRSIGVFPKESEGNT